MFYALLALSIKHNFESSKHAQIIGWFNKNFVHEGKTDERFGKSITKAFNRRTKSDYDAFAEVDHETVTEMFSEMKEFITEIRKLIEKN